MTQEASIKMIEVARNRCQLAYLTHLDARRDIEETGQHDDIWALAVRDSWREECQWLANYLADALDHLEITICQAAHQALVEIFNAAIPAHSKSWKRQIELCLPA